ncbi:hypothetical protein HJC23_009267 [Cyclotella cryptica]|uniref:Sulfotransferase domain-containing protein n=1 Tax=Cyclotella cryptica TaxID=29204 RepID=A0ABD3Q6S7_9STRA|eukprot:CCRYP_008546-RA/>CCRYP_008546-RA protein AED:0.29 eAED:0.29 QI:277/-1/1/1/-1/1/1/255/505
MTNNATLRRRHNTQLVNQFDEENNKRHAARGLWSSKRALSVVVTALFLSCSYPIVRTKLATSENVSLSVTSHHVAKPLAPPKDFDCAIFWLRMPKTASTTIAQTFIRPLFRQGNFTNIEIGPNSCITGVGGCALIWRQMMVRRRTGQNEIMSEIRKSVAPPFGRKSITPKQQSSYNQRCFPSEENLRTNRLTFCQEYDSNTSTLNFGPQRLQDGPNRKKTKLPSRVQAHFDSGPRITTHVGIDPSLFGWILPPNPMVFSTFRDPVERLFSSFHYGIQFGGGRPGSVGKCDLPGAESGKVVERVKRWGEIVVKAREIATLQNNTAPYQDLLRKYLRTCESANDNAYVQFLDPDTKDVNVALQNLEDYVIVGLQNEMGETLNRWVNITRRSCRSHKYFSRMEKVFADIVNDMTAEGEVKKFRESQVKLDETTRRLSVIQQIINRKGIDDDAQKNNTNSSSSINLVAPDFNILDDDLKEIITRYTAGDQKVWGRVLELYEAQREWGRQ